MFACLRRILPSPAEAGFKPPHYRLERNEDNRGLRPRRVMYFLAAKSTDRSLRLVLFAAFWSAVNRGLRPRRVMYFLTAKSTKNSPADAFAYFVPANVRNGRLFAGAHAPRPRFLPLLAGTSFHSFGIGPESFAAFRGGKDASGTSRKHRSLRSPPRGGGGANETAAKNPQVTGLQTTRAAQTPPLKRTLPRAGANEKTKRTRRRRTAKIFATKRQRYPAGEDRGMFHVLSVTKAQTKRPAKRRPFFRRMPDKSL